MWKKIRNAFLRTILITFVSSVLLVVLFRWVPIRYSPLMFYRFIENFSDDTYYTQKHWVPIEQISYNMVLAVLASEDNNFMEHKGFDWDAIKKAYEYNKVNNKTRGASTISQQTAKNVFLFPARNYIRKGLEAYFTFLIELCWTKERILEVYLNVIETGNGIYGVDEAAQVYFGKSAKLLKPQEAAMIAAILPNPRKRNPIAPTPYLQGRQNKIVNLMKLVSPPEIAAYRNAP